MKLIDCFMYFDEDLVLDIRLNTLYDKVDKFIIVEATKNHAGEDKELNFKIENFSKFKSKIDYIVIDDLPKIVKSPKRVGIEIMQEINSKEMQLNEAIKITMITI